MITMNTLTVKTSAKINLTLDVTGKYNNGYHSIESIFQSVGIYDIIKVTRLEKPEILISCSDLQVPCDKTNIVYRAACLFYEHTGADGGAAIDIEKHIPSQAGLGGGSSDGAAVLYALNKIYKTGLEGAELTKLGGMVSADTAFFTVGGTAYVCGIGDEIHSIRYIPKVDIVIAKGRSGISTPDAYKKIDMLRNPHHPDTKRLVKYIEAGKFLKHCDLCGNLFEDVTVLDDVEYIKQIMYSENALTAVMSGSGSSVFGIFPDKGSAVECVVRLKEKYPFAVYCRAEPDSIAVI